MTTCVTIYEVAGNTGPRLFTDAGFSLAGFSGVSVTIRLENGGELNKDAVIDDAAAGEFHVEFGPADLVAGTHELEYVFVAGTQVTRLPANQPVKLIVRPQV
jgi:hypothetical protein